MKYIILIAFCILAIKLSSCRHRHHDIRISVNESGNIYRFTASFPEDKTRRVERLINRSLSLNSFFGNPDDYVDATTILDDQTKVSIKASPGDLRIQLDRDENSEASYHRIKDMCEEIKNELKK